MHPMRVVLAYIVASRLNKTLIMVYVDTTYTECLNITGHMSS